MGKKAILATTFLIISTCALAQTRDQPTVLTDAKVIAALIAFSGVILSAMISFILARVTAKNAVRSEQAKRQGDLALKISELACTRFR